MRERMLYLTIGLLVGIVVMQWGVTSRTVVVPAAYAGYADPTSSGIVAMNAFEVLDENGFVWYLWNGWWPQQSYPPIPVPVSDIKFYDKNVIVTNDNVAWFWDGVGTEWTDLGPWPGGTVPVLGESWGSIKQKLNTEGD